MSQGFCVLAKLGLAAAVWRDSLPDLHVGAVDLLLSYLWGLAVARAFLLFHNTDRTASNPQWREGLYTLAREPSRWARQEDWVRAGSWQTRSWSTGFQL